MITLLTILTLVVCIKIGFGLLKIFGKAVLAIVSFSGVIAVAVALFATGAVLITRFAVFILFFIAAVYVFKTVYKKVIES